MSDLDTLANSSLELRNDGTITNLVEGGLLYNRQTGMGTSQSGSYHTRVGGGYLLAESELRSLYRNNWLIKRLCDIPSFDMTKKSVELGIEDGDEDDVSKVMARWRSPLTDISPYSKRASFSFDKARQEAERWARLFGAGYIVLKCNGDEDPREPLENVRSLDAIAVLDSYSLRPSALDFDKTDPEFYELVYDRNDRLGYGNGILIHESRVLPYYGETLHPFDLQQTNGQSDSCVQVMFEAFLSHYEVTATLKEAINSFSLLTVSVNRLSELLAAGKESAVKKYLQEVALQKSVYRILVTDPEASKTGFEGRNLGGVRENIELFREEMTAASGMPFYKLWGTVGRAGLSDSGANEARAYAELVHTWQGSKFLSNDQRIIKILSQIELGRIPESFEIEYPSIYEPTPQELLMIEEARAKIFQTYSTIPNVVKAQEFRRAIATGQSLENIIDLDEVPSGIDEEQLGMMQAAAQAEAIAKGNAAPRGDEDTELDEVFAKYHQTVNMSASELEAWSKTEASKAASLDRSPITRNLRLLRKNKSEWTANDIKDANRTISFVSRMRGAEQGQPVSKDIDYSKRDISLKNWAFDPRKRNDFSYVRRILKWNGLEIGLEYLPGDRRFNKKMRAAYGHIRKHIGADGEALDCYVSRDFLDDYEDGEMWEGPLFRIIQLSQEDGDFDEHKYIIGVDSAADAEALYRRHMPDWAFGGVEEVGMDEVRSHRRDNDDPKTPAAPSERIRGSATNEEGSASGLRGGIELSAAVEESLRNKVEQHNEKHSEDSKRVTLGMLKAVWRRGAGAYSTSHRPSVSSRQQWAMARVNAFLKLVRSGTPDNPKYTTDYDLLPTGHPKSTRNDSEPVEASGRILSAEEWDALSNVSEEDVLRILGEALE